MNKILIFNKKINKNLLIYLILILYFYHHKIKDPLNVILLFIN
jgi:hypothetical protein